MLNVKQNIDTMNNKRLHHEDTFNAFNVFNEAILSPSKNGWQYMGKKIVAVDSNGTQAKRWRLKVKWWTSNTTHISVLPDSKYISYKLIELYMYASFLRLTSFLDSLLPPFSSHPIFLLKLSCLHIILDILDTIDHLSKLHHIIDWLWYIYSQQYLQVLKNYSFYPFVSSHGSTGRSIFDGRYIFELTLINVKTHHVFMNASLTAAPFETINRQAQVFSENTSSR